MQKDNQLIKMNFLRVRKILGIIILLTAIFLTGYYLGNGGFSLARTQGGNVIINRELPPDKSTVEFSLFWKVWDLVSSKYLDKSKINKTDMVYGAIRGMVSAIGDPYTVFLSPKENKVIDEDLSGSFEGIGIQIGFKGTQLAVIAPLPNSPAEKAGIKAGDFIINIKDDTKKIDMGTAGISLPEAVQAIRGPKGSKVVLTLVREGNDAPIETTIARDKLDVPSVTFETIGEDKTIALVKITKFSQETITEWSKITKSISQEENPKISGIVIDLRNNPGGYLQEAVNVASDFVKNGSVVVIEEDANGVRETLKADRGGKLNSMPVVVLINGGSASASEILAGALRDLRGVKLIGEKSFGKGTIQEPIEMDYGSGIHITTAKWLTPNGTWVNGKGLSPDTEILDNTETAEDEQLLKALEVLGAK